MDILQYLDWGIAGVLAGIIFLAYRNQVKQLRDDRKYMEDKMTGLITDYNKASKAQTDALVKHAAIQTELIFWLKAKNGHS